jgi:Nucleotide modification associated domain 2
MRELMSKLLTYIIPVDDGAAPNPFHGVCSLAICKPVIRRTAVVGDWIVGLGSRRAPSGNLEKHVVFAMKVDKIMSLRQYNMFALRKLKGKIPNFLRNL